MTRLNQKGIAHLLVLIILIIGLLVGLYLVQKTQIFKPKAYSTPAVSLELYNQRTDELRTKFNIPEDVPNEEVQEVVKEELLQNGVAVDGDIAQGEAEVKVVGDCSASQQTNFAFSEYGVFDPPLCLTEEQQQQVLKTSVMVVETGADFIVAYSQAKQATVDALNLGADIATVRKLEADSGVADRVRQKDDPEMIKAMILSGADIPISVTSIGDGYAPTLIRIKELEQDVQENPDGSGKLSLEQEEARREYLLSLRTLWEKQHNILLGLSEAVALSVIDKPLKLIGELVKPITGPIIAKINTTVKTSSIAVLYYLDNATIRNKIRSSFNVPGTEIFAENDFRLDFVCNAYKKALDDLTAKSGVTNLPALRKELLEIAGDGSLNGKFIDFRIPSRSGNTTALGERISLMRLYAKNPEFVRALIDKELIGFHASTSGSLPSMLDSGLLPLTTLRRQGAVLSEGERVYAATETQETVSALPWYNLSQLIEYMGSGKLVTIDELEKNIQSLKHILDSGYTGNTANYEAKIADIENLINFLKSTPDNEADILRQELIKENFPIAFAFDGQGLGGKFIEPYGLADEFLVNEGVPRGNLKALFVPEDKIQFVKDRFDVSGVNIYPIDVVR